MKKLSVPYTIKRRGIYYLNLRWENTFIRKSLATGNPLEAINLINQIRPHLKEAHGQKDNFIRRVLTVLESARPKSCIDNENSELDEVQIKISQAFVVYKDEQEVENWGVRTALQNEATITQLIELVGDIQVASVTKATAREYKKLLLAYPKNRNKGNRINQSINQLLSEGSETISHETVRNTIGRVSSFFNWLIKQGYRDDNPFAGIAPKRTHSTRSERSSFTDDELKVLFGSDLYKEKQFKFEWQYWLPILGLYTGARIEELCQLKVNDFKFAENCHYIAIHGDGDVLNRVKTNCSIRDIPIHADLINMGVLDLTKGKSLDSYIFDLKRVNTNLSHGPSKWFGRYKSSLGFPSGSKVFHSFRHTFRDKLTFAGISSEYVSEMLGHEHLGETFGRYGSAIPVKILSEQLNKVSFESIFS